VRDHEVGPKALDDVEHLRAHLHARRRHCESLELELLDLLEILEDQQRLMARRVVVEQIGDLLALQAPPKLVLDELDRRCALGPIRRGDREDIGIARPIGCRRGAEAGRRARNLILGQPLRQRLRLRRPVEHDRDRTFGLLSLIGLDRRRHLVLVVDLVPFDPVALDPAP